MGAGDKFWGLSRTRRGGSGMPMAGPTATQMDSGHPKRVWEVLAEPGESDPPSSHGLAAKAASTGGCQEGEAPGGARQQRHGHLITKASCPHFHCQNPRLAQGWLMVAATLRGPLWPQGKPIPLQSPWEKVPEPHQSQALGWRRRKPGWPSPACWRVGAHIAPARLPSARPGGGRRELLRPGENSPGFHHPRDGSTAATETRLPVA